MINFQHGQEYNSKARIIGIDPGTTFVGIGVIEFDVVSLNLLSSTAFTINCEKLINDDDWLSFTHGSRFNRIKMLEQKLSQIFEYYQPLLVYAESPFFGLRHPNAFQALTEVLCTIRQCVHNYDMWRILQLVPPTVVKKFLSTKGTSNKIDMKESLLLISNEIKYFGEINLDMLDEHSVDALAIAYYAFNYSKQNIWNFNKT